MYQSFQHRDLLILYTEEHHHAELLVSIFVPSGSYIVECKYTNSFYCRKQSNNIPGNRNGNQFKERTNTSSRETETEENAE